MRKKLLISLIGIMVLAYGALVASVATNTSPALGLDLQGGISVTQQPKPGTAFSSQSLDLAVEKIRERVDSLGVAEPEILRQGDTIVVNLPGVRNQQQAVELVQVTGQVYLRPVTQACFPVNPNPSTSTTVAGGGSTVPGTDAVAPTGTTVPASSTSAAGGPSRPQSSGNTTTSGAATSTSAPTTTVPGPTTSTTAPPLDANGLPIQQSDPGATQFLPLHSSNPPQYCQVGPSPKDALGKYATGEVFKDDAVASVIPGKGWGVLMNLRGGARGEDIWNNLAAECFNKQATCPTGQLS